ncbi:MAG: hypothetical protein AAF449_08015 [Myxococcota bacterium]
MTQPLTARVMPDGAPSFEATIANLTPSSLFLRAARALRFRQSVTIELGALTLYGEVAFVCHEPPGVVVVFRASADVLHTLEDHMEEVPVVEGGELWTPLSDEEPTNPAVKSVEANAVAQFNNSRISTDVDNKVATIVARPSDRHITQGGVRLSELDPPTLTAGHRSPDDRSAMTADRVVTAEHAPDNLARDDSVSGMSDATVLEDPSGHLRREYFASDRSDSPVAVNVDADD